MNTQLSEAPVLKPSTNSAGPSIRISAASERGPEKPAAETGTVVELRNVSCFYGSFRAVRNVDIKVARQRITALIGPSGCGKSTLLRTINRMNDLVPKIGRAHV